MFLRTATAKSMNACYDKMSRLKQELNTADAVVIVVTVLSPVVWLISYGMIIMAVYQGNHLIF